MAKTQVVRIHDGRQRTLTPREARAIAREAEAAIDQFVLHDDGKVDAAPIGRGIFDAHD